MKPLIVGNSKRDTEKLLLIKIVDIIHIHT